MQRRTLLVNLALVSLLLGVLLRPLPALAQPEGFSETFDGEPAGWELAPESLVTGGVLKIGPGNFAARPGAWRNFELALTLRYTGRGESHINYRAGEGGSYLLLFSEEGTVLLRTVEGSEPQELARADASPLSGGAWADVTISLSGGAHTISVDGETLLTATDPDPLRPGAVVLASHGERTTEVDEIALEVVAGDEPVAEAGETLVVPTPAPATPTPAPGTLETLVQALASGQGSTFEIDTFVINILLAVVTSYVLSRVYIYWGASLSNRRKFAANFMLVTVTTTFIILVVRSSVALSLGLVGALSIIRFRAAIKEPEELAYLFFAISLGIGLGDNQRTATLIALVVVVGLVGIARLLRQTQADVNLHLTVASGNSHEVEMQEVMDVVAEHASKVRLLRYDENGSALELSFVVEFEHTADINAMRKALRALSPSLEISFLDNKGVW
jgi:hypothetical protein